MNKKNKHRSNKLDIICLYLSDYFSSYSGREIARRIKVSPQTALNYLLELVMIKVQDKKKIFPHEINIHFVTWQEFKRSYLQKTHLALEIKKDHLIYSNVFKIIEVYNT